MDSSSLSEAIGEKGIIYVVANVFFYSIIVFALFQINVKIHEFGHIIPLKAFGCEITQTDARYLTGETGFICKKSLTPLGLTIIGLGGPMLALLWGFLLWQADSSWIKFGALACFFYSVIPNLALEIIGSDMYYVVSQGGVSPGIAILIYLATVGIIAFEVVSWIEYKIVHCESR